MNSWTSSQQPWGEPGEATAERGVVVLDGPNGLAISLTPDAAEAMARSLATAATAARGQRPAASDNDA